MIIKSTGWKSSDGAVHATLEAAQRAELRILFESVNSSDILDAIIEQRDKVLDILTTTATSKPKARAINGGKKVRKPKAEAEATLFKEPATNSAA